MAAKIRNALTLYRPLCAVENIDIRLHRTVLYNSIYRAGDQLWSISTPMASRPRRHPCSAWTVPTAAIWPPSTSIVSSVYGQVLRRSLSISTGVRLPLSTSNSIEEPNENTQHEAEDLDHYPGIGI